MGSRPKESALRFLDDGGGCEERGTGEDEAAATEYEFGSVVASESKSVERMLRSEVNCKRCEDSAIGDDEGTGACSRGRFIDGDSI